MNRLKIKSKSSNHLILQPAEQNSDSPKMAYLIRQPLENKLRQQIDKWHNTLFSPLTLQKIQCQLEINQDFFEWNDSTVITRPLDNNYSASPPLSTHSACSNRTKQFPWYSSAASTVSYQKGVSKKSHIVGQLHVTRSVPTNHSIVLKKEQTTNSLRSKSGTKSCKKYCFFVVLIVFA
jgi:hypothetical protein